MTTLAKEKEPIHIEVLNLLVKVLTKEHEAIMFQETYYKNKFLERAINMHLSPRCIIRTYAEMLKTAYRFTNDNTDMLHANALLNYLRISDDEKDLEYINDLVYFLRNECCERCQDVFPFLILKPKGRIKSFVSYEVNERNKLLKFKILRELNTSSMENLNDLFSEKRDVIFDLLKKNYSEEEILQIDGSIFSDKVESDVKSYIQEQLELTVKKNSFSDLVGYRFIVYSVNHSTKEEVLIDYLHPLEDKIKDFFLNEGFLCTKRKDFVNFPKPNGYQSIHLQFEIMQISVEFQLRTKKMDDTAEKGSAAHESEYKDKNPMYIFINDLLRNYSKNYGKTDVHELLGLLKPLDTSNRPWNSTSETIPYTPKELKEFQDVDFITNCLDM